MRSIPRRLLGALLALWPHFSWAAEPLMPLALPPGFVLEVVSDDLPNARQLASGPRARSSPAPGAMAGFGPCAMGCATPSPRD